MRIFLLYDLDGLLNMILLLLFGPSALFLLIGIALRFANKKKAAKVMFILAVVYQIISLGICGAVIYS